VIVPPQSNSHVLERALFPTSISSVQAPTWAMDSPGTLLAHVFSPRTLNSDAHSIFPGPMAVSGSLVMAGAPAYRPSTSYSYMGAVMVFIATSTGMEFKQLLYKPDNRTSEYFGTDIAVVCSHMHHGWRAAYRIPGLLAARQLCLCISLPWLVWHHLVRRWHLHLHNWIG
jgi:hypothetical protein